MNNPNLTPVVITDKRGRTTTVHRRMDKPAKTKHALADRPITSPDSTAEYERFKPKGRKAFQEMGSKAYGNVSVKTLTCIAMLDEPLLGQIVARVKEGGIEQKLWLLNLAYRDPFDAKNPGRHPRTLEQYREALELYPLALRLLNEENALNENDAGNTLVKVDSYINEAERYAEDSNYDLPTMKAHMLASAIEAFDFEDDDQHVKETLEFIVDNMDAVIQKLPVLITRGSRDAGLMNEVLNSNNDALADGIL